MDIGSKSILMWRCVCMVHESIGRGKFGRQGIHRNIDFKVDSLMSMSPAGSTFFRKQLNIFCYGLKDLSKLN
jgi:hypothetical protein